VYQSYRGRRCGRIKSEIILTMQVTSGINDLLDTALHAIIMLKAADPSKMKPYVEEL
jgi:hypothetical protein